MKGLLRIAQSLSLSLALLAGSAHAQQAPDVLVRQVTGEVLSIVKEDKGLQSGNTQRAIELVDAKVLPHFDFARMTALAMGREWNKATPAQKEQLTREFKTLLVRTYSNALTQYKNQSIDVKPLKLQAADTDVTVRTVVLQPGARKPIQLDYSLAKQGDAWKVYDVVVEGVSLVTNYRESFGQEVRSNGIDSLLKTLATKNRGAAGKS